MKQITIILLGLLLMSSILKAQNLSPDISQGDTLRVNFQPPVNVTTGSSPFPGDTVPDGFLPDYGYVFNTNGAYSYGWDMDVSLTARQRVDPATTGDNPKGNFIHLNRSSVDASWKIKLKPGLYSVNIVGGDAANIDQINGFIINNVVLTDTTPKTSYHDEFNNINVVVGADSFLTVKSSAIPNNAKICYIEIFKFALRVNFQPPVNVTTGSSPFPGDTVPDGFLPDYGYVFSTNGAYSYGWEMDPNFVLSGNKTLKLGQQASSMIYQRIIIEPGVYIFSATGKELSPNGQASRVDIWDKADANKLFRLQFTSSDVTTLYAKASFASLDTFIVEAYTRSGGLDSAYFDDISISKYIKPVIELNSPVNDLTANIGDKITVSAATAFTKRVKFFVDGSLIGEKTEAPYSLEWEAVNAGTFNFSSAAFDIVGDSVLSEGISVVVRAGNLLVNGGFEDDLLGWEDKGGKINIVTDPALVIKGNKTLKLGKMASSTIWQRVIIEPGVYIFSATGKEFSPNGQESRVEIWDKTDSNPFCRLSLLKPILVLVD